MKTLPPLEAAWPEIERRVRKMIESMMLQDTQIRLVLDSVDDRMSAALTKQHHLHMQEVADAIKAERERLAKALETAYSKSSLQIPYGVRECLSEIKRKLEGGEG